MERKDELKDQVEKLKSLLDSETSKVSSLKSRLEESERKSGDLTDKYETRIKTVQRSETGIKKLCLWNWNSSSFYRENELLKHQLKKYVGAVQKLRDHNSAEEAKETLTDVEKNVDEGQGKKAAGDTEVEEENEEKAGKKYVDYHFEASEFEKKLIQVAEMQVNLFSGLLSYHLIFFV